MIPSWVVRWGITVICSVFIGLFGIAYFVRYPETIQAPIKVKVISESVNILRGSAGVTGQAFLASKGFGKIAVGQSVYVRLDCFPYMEFGKLRGKVQHIYPDLQNNKYAIDISFPEGLMTTYGKKLSPVHEMNGECEIVIDDKRLVRRLMEPLLSLVRK